MRFIRFLTVVLPFVAIQSAAAQRPQPVAFSAPVASHVNLTTGAAALPGNSGMPRWLRWGLVGAIGGAVLFTLANGFNGGSNSTGGEILAGAATGFVIVGGGVLLYDLICPPGSGSRSGFCGR